jgi:biofilm PGA synthesis lipoprotein PgaB
MGRFLRGILFSLFLCPPALAAELPVLVYHDIVTGKPQDDYAVSRAMFAEQMAFLHDNGYRPVSLHTLADVAAGRGQLPEKAVMLTFDDGLRSFQHAALPELQKYAFPAVLSICTGWLDGHAVPDAYRGRLLTWGELRALSRSPLIEVLSHTDNLHIGIPSNPQGNVAPAGTTRRYDPAGHDYESDREFRQRIRADLARSAERLKAETGRSPVGITWPYGYSDGIAEDEARQLGMQWQLTISGEPARTAAFPRIGRIVLYRARTLADFERLLLTRARPPQRILEIDLDDLISRQSAERERWLSALLVRIELLRIDAVIVSPFDRSGTHAFFSTNVAADGDDYLNRVLSQIRTRAGIRSIYLRLPAGGIAESVFTELARRQPYDGIVLSHDTPSERAAELRALFTRYQPGLRCGTEGMAMRPDCHDFSIRTLNPENAAHATFPEAGGSVPAYIVVEKDIDPHGKHLAAALRSLQRAGISYVGLQDSVLFDNPEIVTRTAVQLAEMNRGRN